MGMVEHLALDLFSGRSAILTIASGVVLVMVAYKLWKSGGIKRPEKKDKHQRR